MKLKTIYTNGTFDVLHIGHINLLQRARELGDRLVVGVNTDEYLAEKKGKHTIYPYEQRAELLQAVSYVDEVVPIRSLEDKYFYFEQYQVSLFVIGSDYRGYPDMQNIRDFGVPVQFLERTENVASSITRIEMKIRDSEKRIDKILTDNQRNRSILVIDLDNTICETVDHDYENAKPNQAVIDKINQLHTNGWHIIIHTSRGEFRCEHEINRIIQTNYPVAKDWLEKYGVQYDEIRFGKPSGMFYVDDKNLSIEEFINLSERQMQRMV